MQNKSPFLQTALEAAKKAEEVILKYYTDDIRATLKPDMSPVTIADQEAEAIIIETIKAKFPDHGFLGEETGLDKEDAEYQWIIDPIDGTKNYIRQIPLFGTLIALTKHEEVVLGISNVPLQNEMVYAEKGKGTYIGDKKVTVSDVQNVSDAFITFGGTNAFVANNTGEKLQKLVATTWRDRGIGDCYCYHLLATGRSDAMIEAKISFWDVAPAKIIIEEAGGKVTDQFGKPLTKDSKNILATNGHLHEELQAFFIA